MSTDDSKASSVFDVVGATGIQACSVSRTSATSSVRAYALRLRLASLPDDLSPDLEQPRNRNGGTSRPRHSISNRAQSSVRAVPGFIPLRHAMSILELLLPQVRAT